MQLWCVLVERVHRYASMGCFSPGTSFGMVVVSFDDTPEVTLACGAENIKSGKGLTQKYYQPGLSQLLKIGPIELVSPEYGAAILHPFCPVNPVF